MFCPECGKELKDSYSFCPRCGAAVNDTRRSIRDVLEDSFDSVRPIEVEMPAEERQEDYGAAEPADGYTAEDHEQEPEIFEELPVQENRMPEPADEGPQVAAVYGQMSDPGKLLASVVYGKNGETCDFYQDRLIYNGNPVFYEELESISAYGSTHKSHKSG